MDLPFCKKRLCFRVFYFVKKKRWRFCGGIEWEEGVGGRRQRRWGEKEVEEELPLLELDQVINPVAL